MRHRVLRLALLCCTTAASASLASEQELRLAEGPGSELTAARCVICHSVDYIEMVSPAMDRVAWQKSIRKMVEVFGAPVSEEEAHAILEYLSEHYSATHAGAKRQE